MGDRGSEEGSRGVREGRLTGLRVGLRVRPPY